MAKKPGKTRSESDAFGPLDIPADKLWGAQTERSLHNFRIGTERMPIEIVRALGLIKRAAAEVNRDLGSLDARRAKAIVAVAQDIADGKLDEHFPLLVWQTGSGTQTNMNVNEVIANAANVALGGEARRQKAGASERSRQYEPVVQRLDPDRHAHRRGARDRAPSAAGAHAPARRARQEGQGIRQDRQNRPHPHHGRNARSRLGQEFSGYAAQVKSAIARHRRWRSANFIRWRKAAPRSAPGSIPSRNSPRPSPSASRNSPSCPSFSAPNKFEHMAGHDAYVFVHGALNAAATALFKIANDIRLLGSGPRSGLGELILPSNELGSSIMPGKTNPTQSEALTMVCCQVFGNQTTITVAGSQGHFELNVYKPVLAYCMLQSIRLLADAATSFTDNCVVGIRANEPRIRELMQRSLMLVTALSPKIGYDKAAQVAKAAHCQRHDAARGSGAARIRHRRRIRPPGAAGKDDPPALSRMRAARECNSGTAACVSCYYSTAPGRGSGCEHYVYRE